MNQHHINCLLRPRSVAVIGASDDPSRVGGRPLHYLKSGGFQGEIYPVNPKRDIVQGLRAYASIAAVHRPVDCAVLAVSAETTIATLRECAEAGVGSAIVFSAGFAEAGAEGRSRQAEMNEICAQSGMRILGPNCLGLYALDARAFLTMSGLFQNEFPESGTLGVVSQSGGYAGQLAYIARQRGIGIGSWVTTGNEADVDLSEILVAFAGDPSISAVLVYIEGIKDGPRFIAALEALRAARKPLIAFKVGTSSRGARAVASHTASMSGEDMVFDAVFAEFGVQRVHSTEEALDVAYAAARGTLPRGGRYAAVTTSGGVGGQLADLAEAHGLAMPDTSEALSKRLRDIAPLGSPANPVDVSGQVVNDPTIMGRSIEALIGSDMFDIVHTFIGFSAGIPWLAEKYLDTMVAAARTTADQLLIATISGDPDLVRSYEKAGYLVFEEPSRAIRAVAALVRMARAFEQPPRAPRPRMVMTGRPDAGAPSDAAQAVLDAIGVALPEEISVGDARAAGQAAARLGRPVALKIVSSDIPHKTEFGGVVLGLRGEAEVAAAATKMLATVAERAPSARIEGLKVCEMIDGGVECVLAYHLDPTFGPVVTFGMGGVLVELMQDTSLRRAPVDHVQARAMIDGLRCSPIFHGFRGAPELDVDAVADAIARLSEFACANGDAVPGFEINPMLVRRKGEKLLALDVLADHEGMRA